MACSYLHESLRPGVSRLASGNAEVVLPKKAQTTLKSPVYMARLPKTSRYGSVWIYPPSGFGVRLALVILS